MFSDLGRRRGRAPRRVGPGCHRPCPVAPLTPGADGRALDLLVELLEDVLALFQRVDLELVAGVGDDLGSYSVMLRDFETTISTTF